MPAAIPTCWPSAAKPQARRQKPRRNRRPEGRARPPAKPPQPGKGKLSYKQKYALETLPGQIEELSGAIAALEAKLADPALFAKDAAAFQPTRRRTGREARNNMPRWRRNGWNWKCCARRSRAADLADTIGLQRCQSSSGCGRAVNDPADAHDPFDHRLAHAHAHIMRRIRDRRPDRHSGRRDANIRR
jgi:hypothetical protein